MGLGISSWEVSGASLHETAGDAGIRPDFQGFFDRPQVRNRSLPARVAGLVACPPRPRSSSTIPPIPGSPTTSTSPTPISAGASRRSGASSSRSRRSSCAACSSPGAGPVGARHARPVRRPVRRSRRRIDAPVYVAADAVLRRVVGLQPPPGRGRGRRPLADAAGRRGARQGPAGRGARTGQRPREPRGAVPERGRARRRRGAARPRVLRSAVPPLCAGARSGTCCGSRGRGSRRSTRCGGAGFTTFALTPAADATPIDAVEWPERAALLFGRGGPGSLRRVARRRRPRGSASRWRRAPTRSTSRPPPPSRSTPRSTLDVRARSRSRPGRSERSMRPSSTSMRRVSEIASSSARSCVTSSNVPGVVLERRLELLDRGQVEVVRRLVEHEAVDALRAEQRERRPRPLAGRERVGGPGDVLGAEPELGEQRPRLARHEPARGLEAREQRRVARERGPRLVELADDHARPEPRVARVDRAPADDARRAAWSCRCRSRR